jgi:hypothetical protein
MSIDYAFNEEKLLEEMKTYIDNTYSAHYSQNQYQSTQIIEDMGHGMGFALGNVIKYCQRYGKKDGFNRNDLKKEGSLLLRCMITIVSRLILLLKKNQLVCKWIIKGPLEFL